MPCPSFSLPLLLLLACLCSSVEDRQQLFPPQARYLRLVFSGDSGYIRAAEGLPALRAAGLTDTLHPYNGFQSTDTVGKYYRIPERAGYLVCASQLSHDEGHTLAEIGTDGRVVRAEPFYHGNYACCWTGYREGFRKYGDFFGLKICGTGSGHCADYLFLFQEVIPQAPQYGILMAYTSAIGPNGIRESLSGTLSLHQDSLKVHYLLSFRQRRPNGNPGKTCKEPFDLWYRWNRDGWHASDSARLARLDG